jgi:hypothetical protein
LLFLACAVVSAQSPPSSGGSDLDGLFTDNGAPGSDSAPGNSGTAQPATNPPVAPEAVIRADDPTQDQKIHYFGSLNIYGLFGVGWSGMPVGGDLSSTLGNEASGSFTASLGFEVRPATQLRLRGTLSYSFPASSAQFSEFIVDYSIREAVFFRLGTFDYTWGNSQFFQFSNLPSRSLPDWGLNNVPIWQRTNIIANAAISTAPVSVKMTIPFGLNSLTFLSRFDMQNYGFPNATTPDPRDAGYGLQFSLVTGPIEWTLAGFYQRLLTPRSSLALKTSLMGFDLSAETTVAFPVNFTLNGMTPISTTSGGIYVGGLMQRIYPTAVLGFSREWPDARIRLYAEYAYNGERDPGTSWLTDESGPGGHNSVVVLRFANMASSGISLNMLWQHNWSDGSGLVSPFFEVSPVPLTTIQLGPVFVYGPDGSETLANRIVPGGKRVELLLLVKVSESYRQ